MLDYIKCDCLCVTRQNRRTLTHSALLKQLGRARKVWLLVGLFGKEILPAEAVANISVLDTVPIRVFGDLATSNTETAFVTEIRKLFAKSNLLMYRT
jgi:hypothetical protein